MSTSGLAAPEIINAPLLSTTSAEMKPQVPRYENVGLSSDGAWITYDSENVLWLPSDYRPSCSTVCAKTVAIGVGSGKVWMCSFNVDGSGDSVQ
jgi:hypothetical protein